MAVMELTDDEFGLAAVWANKLLRVQGPTDFGYICLGAARNHTLSREQFNAIKRTIDAGIPHKERTRKKINQGKSRKPITLPKVL